MSASITFDDAPVAQVSPEVQVLPDTEKQSSKYPLSRIAGLRPFQPGQSGNPGGWPKGVPRISDAYARLIKLSPAELESFEPANVAELAALKQIRATIDGTAAIKALPSLQEITDRTEGKARQVLEVNTGLEHERMIIRLQERFLARTGIELSRDEAVARLAEIDPAFAQLGD